LSCPSFIARCLDSQIQISQQVPSTSHSRWQDTPIPGLRSCKDTPNTVNRLSGLVLKTYSFFFRRHRHQVLKQSRRSLLSLSMERYRASDSNILPMVLSSNRHCRPRRLHSHRKTSQTWCSKVQLRHHQLKTHILINNITRGTVSMLRHRLNLRDKPACQFPNQLPFINIFPKAQLSLKVSKRMPLCIAVRTLTMSELLTYL
jgi:hypothetical protein